MYLKRRIPADTTRGKKWIFKWDTYYYLEDSEAATQLPDDAGLLLDLPDGGDARLLLGLHAAAGDDPVVGFP